MADITNSILSEENETEYVNFLENHPGALFFHSLKYKHFLTVILESSEGMYLLAHSNSELVGVLPIFVKTLDNDRSLINSLPFYGSHGGVLIAEGIENQEEVKKALVDELVGMALEKNAISMTVVDNPAAAQSELYKGLISTEPSDERIGQITNIGVNMDNLEEELMAVFHSKTRNMVRKGMKSGFEVKRDESLDSIKKIYEIHSQNMEAIGGTEKPLFIFEAIHEIFEAENDYAIYFAEKNGETAAGLLVFYYKEYCEYFTPVINQR